MNADTHKRSARTVWGGNPQDYLPYVFMLVLLCCYAALLDYFRKNALLQPKEYIGNVTALAGWIAALLTVLIHLSKTRADNRKAKQDELRRTLEVDAFREINKATNSFSGTLMSVGTSYVFWPVNLKVGVGYQAPRFDPAKAHQEMWQHVGMLSKGMADFVLAVEANEIAALQFHHYRLFIQLRTFEAKEAIEAFRDTLSATQPNTLLSPEGMVLFESECAKIFGKLLDVSGYLHDYRIELMNRLLSEVFETSVPPRKPGDSRHKILREAAVPEDVEKEWAQREKAAGEGKARI